MENNEVKVIGITKMMELHIHGVTEGKEWYTNLSIPKIIDILTEYTEYLGDKKETEMLDHIGVYFYDKI